MGEIKFQVWHKKDQKLYYRGYQKFSHVLLCEDDQGKNQGQGNPVKRASYEDCVFLQGTGIEDVSGKEIFEGDVVEIEVPGSTFQGTVENVPDMFKSRGLHPLHALLEEHGVDDKTQILKIKIIGNQFTD